MKIINFLLFLITFNIVCNSQENNQFIDKLAQQLKDYYNFSPSKKIYLKTDKDIYAPGENLWFSGFIIDRGLDEPSSYVRGVIIKIINNNGLVVWGDSYPVASGFFKGDLKIPENLIIGRYYIVAYSPDLSNMNDLFLRPIFIDQVYKTDLIVKFSGEKILQSGKAETLRFNLYDISLNPLAQFRLDCKIILGDKKIFDEKIKTDNSGVAVVSFTPPPNIKNDPLILEISDPKGNWKTIKYLKTTTDKLKVNFYPEGGKLLSGTMQKVGFAIHDNLDRPIEIQAAVEDEKNNLLTKANTFSRGYGIIPVNLNQNQKARLIVGETVDERQVFDLPAPSENGLSLTVPMVTDQFIFADILCRLREREDFCLVATKGLSLVWATRFTVQGNSRLKIPVQDLPQGVILLSVFDKAATNISNRLVYINKNKKLKFSITSKKTENSLMLDIVAFNEKNEPVDAVGCLSVCDITHLWSEHLSCEEVIPLNSEIKNQVYNATTIFDSVSFYYNALNYNLIINEPAVFNWKEILANNSSTRKETISDEKMDERLMSLVKNVDAYYSGYTVSRETQQNYLIQNSRFILPGPRKQTLSRQSYKNESYKKLLENSTDILDVIKTIKPFQLMNGQIVFSGTINSINFQSGALIVIDGQKMGTQVDIIRSLSPLDIEEINISTNPMDIQKYTGLNSVGVIEIKTKRGNMPVSGNVVKSGDEVQYKDGYRVPREFASTSDDANTTGTTLYWAPELKFNKSGKASISIPLSAIKTDFAVSVEGTDLNGRFGKGKVVVSNK